MQHILILSQDEEYRNALIDLLKDCDYTAYSSNSIEDTVDQFYSKKLDLIIIDVESWKEEGIRVYKNLKHELGEKDFFSIIIIPADLMNSVEFSLAFNDFVIKNENLKEVLLRIRQLLGRPSQMDSNKVINIEDLIKKKNK